MSRLKEPRITKVTKAMIPDTTNSPGDAVLSFQSKIVILLLLSSSKETTINEAKRVEIIVRADEDLRLILYIALSSIS